MQYECLKQKMSKSIAKVIKTILLKQNILKF